MRKYLDNPPQYFNALPNFMGVRLVGSDSSRIEDFAWSVDEKEKGNYLGSIEIDGSSITLSPRLNAIVGGRGSGKSVLLDSVANYLDLNKCANLLPGRVAFLNSQSICVRNMLGEEIQRCSFVFDYYNQSYIAKLFDKEGQAYSDELSRYFREAFDNVPNIDTVSIEAANATAFADLFEEAGHDEIENITGLVEKYALDKADGLSIAVRSANKPKEDKKLSGFDYSAAMEKLDQAFKKAIPAFLNDNSKIAEAFEELKFCVAQEAFKKRLDYLSTIDLKIDLIQGILDRKSNISKAQKEKIAVEGLFQGNFTEKSKSVRDRVSLVNAYISAEQDFKHYYEEFCFADGLKPRSFKFLKTLRVESPLEHMKRLFDDAFLAEKMPSDRRTIGYLPEYIDTFCFDETGYKSGCSVDALYENLKRFELNYTSGKDIQYLGEDGTYLGITNLSPGTQANILLEYIVHSDTSRPLLIDQPEDNVDNQTIYGKIRDWFSKLKSNRQVIVVTHDANIVINSDAENLIFATQETPGSFSYENGALEYDGYVDRAATILDGGKIAVKRRLMKYGE